MKIKPSTCISKEQDKEIKHPYKLTIIPLKSYFTYLGSKLNECNKIAERIRKGNRAYYEMQKF
jgi:hypothetical protein